MSSWSDQPGGWIPGSSLVHGPVPVLLVMCAGTIKLARHAWLWRVPVLGELVAVPGTTQRRPVIEVAHLHGKAPEVELDGIPLEFLENLEKAGWA